MSNDHNDNNDIYGSYYENNNQSLYNIESDNKNHVKEFSDSNSKNSIRNRFLRLIIGILVVISILWGIYYFIKDQLISYQVKTNLTSFGLVKTRLKNSSYQLQYLIIPSKDSIPKIRLSNNNLIINETTANITTSKLGETKIDFLDIINNKKIDSSITVYIVSKEIPIEDFTCKDITLNVSSKDIISITPSPSNATEIEFTYKSNDPNIVSVSNNGIIKGLKKGNATIIITNKEITKTVNVHVE